MTVSFITSKFSEHNTENEGFEKSLVLQKCPLTHITLIIIIITIIIIVIIIIMIMITIKKIIINSPRPGNTGLMSSRG